jgi:hypothetical protein
MVIGEVFGTFPGLDSRLGTYLPFIVRLSISPQATRTQRKVGPTALLTYQVIASTVTSRRASVSTSCHTIIRSPSSSP